MLGYIDSSLGTGTWKVKAGWSWVWDQPGLHKEIFSQKLKQKLEELSYNNGAMPFMHLCTCKIKTKTKSDRKGRGNVETQKIAAMSFAK